MSADVWAYDREAREAWIASLPFDAELAERLRRLLPLVDIDPDGGDHDDAA